MLTGARQFPAVVGHTSMAVRLGRHELALALQNLAMAPFGANGASRKGETGPLTSTALDYPELPSTIRRRLSWRGWRDRKSGVDQFANRPNVVCDPERHCRLMLRIGASGDADFFMVDGREPQIDSESFHKSA